MCVYLLQLSNVLHSQIGNRNVATGTSSTYASCVNGQLILQQGGLQTQITVTAIIIAMTTTLLQMTTAMMTVTGVELLALSRPVK